MNKGLEALQKLRDLVEYLTRIDYVPSDLRNEVKELLIKSYKDSNGYFSQIEEALKQAQKQEKLLELYRELDDCIVAPTGHHVCRYTDDEKYARIRKQIKELENDKQN